MWRQPQPHKTNENHLKLFIIEMIIKFCNRKAVPDPHVIHLIHKHWNHPFWAEIPAIN